MNLFPAIKPFSRFQIRCVCLGQLFSDVHMALIRAFVIVEGKIARNGIEPGKKWTRIAIGMGVLYQAQKGLLREIFCTVLLPNNAIEVRYQ
ncbi:hypothetical protein KDK_46300 [Dictyobacter kobayashii]|uniref:Uncharacterized protein n=1 Tax=Dictyobacter kobayashii TaxID=2014872 RepID=A0A402APD3_9CHLR|nr:hypothetical protein KDK_46300 [Dictyobacter kobayashii]